MLKYAIYLPQFHEIKENNEWWGQGFTEWNNVKNAKKMFRSHRQPRVPKDKNYYNLMDKETVEWQTELLKEYNLDGLIYYHYYFDGKLIMEKPAENLLQWNDIKQNFFFCWANHTWYKAVDGKKSVLIEQTYGDEESWGEHFLYLNEFFQDVRYLKINNKPVFMIFSPEDMLCKKEMMNFFDAKCKECGFDGIYVIETFRDGVQFKKALHNFEKETSNQTELIYIREPDVSRSCYKFERKYLLRRVFNKFRRELAIHCFPALVPQFSADSFYEIMIKNIKEYRLPKHVHGIFFEWDNTPRHKVRGEIIHPVSKKKFDEYIDEIKTDSMIIINAWNEWAEGMMLEPTEQDSDKYLSWLKNL